MASSTDGEKPTNFSVDESVLRHIHIQRSPGHHPAEESKPREGSKGTQHTAKIAKAGAIRDVSMLDHLRSRAPEAEGR
jgi:hypothetical protein